MSVAKYVHTVASEAAHGVAETTHYAALKDLLNEAGEELTPKVRTLIHPRGSGVGIPDGEFWTAGDAHVGDDPFLVRDGQFDGVGFSNVLLVKDGPERRFTQNLLEHGVFQGVELSLEVLLAG